MAPIATPIGIGTNYAVYLWMTMEVRAALGIHGNRPQCLHRQPVSILYTDGYGASTTRTIEPIRYFRAYDGREIVRAFCQMRREERTFRIDRVESARRYTARNEAGFAGASRSSHARTSGGRSPNWNEGRSAASGAFREARGSGGPGRPATRRARHNRLLKPKPIRI